MNNNNRKNRSRKQSGGLIVYTAGKAYYSTLPIITYIVKSFAFFISISGFLSILYYIKTYGIKKISDWILYSDRKVVLAKRLILINLIGIYFAYLFSNGNTNALQYLKELAVIVKESMKNVELSSSALEQIQSTIGKVITKIGPTFKNIINNNLLQILTATGITTAEFIRENIETEIKKLLIDNNGYYKVSFDNWMYIFNNLGISDPNDSVKNLFTYEVYNFIIRPIIKVRRIDRSTKLYTQINIATNDQKNKNEFYKINVIIYIDPDYYYNKFKNESTYNIYKCNALNKYITETKFSSKCDIINKYKNKDDVLNYINNNILINTKPKFVYIYLNN
jgi:hypothetical protein